MVPLRVYLKNFLCHQEQEFLFDGHAVWLLHGPNGVGKSAVFDAMVYALFGQHQRNEVTQNSGVDLIRHGQSAFRVEFDFEYDGRRYRIWRTRSKNGTTQGASEIIDGAPRPVRDVNKVKELDGWVVATLGLTYDTFVSAVLLRQGAAEKLIDAKKDVRREMLRGIIDLDRFIKLHTAITDARTSVGREARSLNISLERLSLVTDEQIASATAQRDAAVTAWRNAQSAEHAAHERLGHSRFWEQWNKNADDIRRELEAAAGRAARAAELQRTVERLTLLREGLASLASVTSRRGEVRTARSELKRLQADCDQVTKLVDLDRRIAEATATGDHLRTELKQAQLRQQLEKRREDLSSFESDLDDQADRANKAVDEARAAKDAFPYLEGLVRHRADYQQAVRDEHSATEAETSAESEVAKRQAAESEAELALRAAENRKATAEQAKAVANHASTEAAGRRDRFATVAEAVRCSECGQPIDAEHAVRERTKLDQAASAAAETVAKCRDDLAAATSTATGQKGVHARRQEEHRQAITLRDSAKRAREQAEKRRKDARAAFDQARGGLTAQYSECVAPIDGNGFPGSTDVDACNTLKSRLTGLVQEQDRIRRRVEARSKAASDIATLVQAVSEESPLIDSTAAGAELQRLAWIPTEGKPANNMATTIQNTILR